MFAKIKENSNVPCFTIQVMLVYVLKMSVSQEKAESFLIQHKVISGGFQITFILTSVQKRIRATDKIFWGHDFFPPRTLKLKSELRD